MSSEISGGIDWAALHQRLDASRKALERRLMPSFDEKRQVLRARAKLFAREPANTGSPSASLQIVEFLLAYEHYGIDTSHIREICALNELRSVPGTPPFVIGLMHIRGKIVSVIDIKKFFDLPEKGLTDLNKVLIVRVGQVEVGILADAILSVRTISLDCLQPTLPTLTGIRADYVKGITRDPLVVLDAERLLSDKRILVNED